MCLERNSGSFAMLKKASAEINIAVIREPLWFLPGFVFSFLSSGCELSTLFFSTPILPVSMIFHGSTHTSKRSHVNTSLFS